MWISSIVATLSPPEAGDSARTIEALATISALTLGERQGDRLPIVIEAPDGAASRYWYEWIEQLPGVLHVEVAFVSFDESDRADPIEAPREEAS